MFTGVGGNGDHADARTLKPMFRLTDLHHFKLQPSSSKDQEKTQVCWFDATWPDQFKSSGFGNDQRVMWMRRLVQRDRVRVVVGCQVPQKSQVERKDGRMFCFEYFHLLLCKCSFFSVQSKINHLRE